MVFYKIKGGEGGTIVFSSMTSADFAPCRVCGFLRCKIRPRQPWRVLEQRPPGMPLGLCRTPIFLPTRSLFPL